MQNKNFVESGRDEFPPDVTKELFHLRWGEETSFRDLKYTIDLVHFHCKKRGYIEQEACARLIVYNFCEAITRHISITRQTGKDCDRKYGYKINFATAACICRAFLKRSDGEINPCRLIGKYYIIFLTGIQPVCLPCIKIRNSLGLPPPVYSFSPLMSNFKPDTFRIFGFNLFVKYTLLN